ncbi:hypothetical protein G5I_02520 [Acromyrmex echinatior]|uniref:Uncharacterized protein n=1 Tax=Acromyrmex echinatior TaxID=103372 RepID=F4WAI3_ACREC|nr:hypothetical protein G5I_02520 [Acromyrmex echinatior]
MVIKVVSLKLSRCTLTLLQRLDWYDRFVVSGALVSTGAGVVLAGFQVCWIRTTMPIIHRIISRLRNDEMRYMDSAYTNASEKEEATGVLCTGLRGKWPSNSLDVP